LIQDTAKAKDEYTKFLRGAADKIESGEIALPEGILLLGVCVDGTTFAAWKACDKFPTFTMIGLMESEKHDLLNATE